MLCAIRRTKFINHFNSRIMAVPRFEAQRRGLPGQKESMPDAHHNERCLIRAKNVIPLKHNGNRLIGKHSSGPDPGKNPGLMRSETARTSPDDAQHG
jgi:hypothetical protein